MRHRLIGNMCTELLFWEAQNMCLELRMAPFCVCKTKAMGWNDATDNFCSFSCYTAFTPHMQAELNQRMFFSPSMLTDWSCHTAHRSSATAWSVSRAETAAGSIFAMLLMLN